MNRQYFWTTVGKKEDLIPGAGVGALADEKQLALFWIPELNNRVFALDNYCPFSGVNIIARGIVGDIAGEPVVATPLYKQHFSLLDGHCIEEPEVKLQTLQARLKNDVVQVRLMAREAAA